MKSSSSRKILNENKIFFQQCITAETLEGKVGIVVEPNDMLRHSNFLLLKNKRRELSDWRIMSSQRKYLLSSKPPYSTGESCQIGASELSNNNVLLPLLCKCIF